MAARHTVHRNPEGQLQMAESLEAVPATGIRGGAV